MSFPTVAQYEEAVQDIATKTSALWATLSAPEQRSAALALCGSLKAARGVMDEAYGVIRPLDGGDPKP